MMTIQTLDQAPNLFFFLSLTCLDWRTQNQHVDKDM